MNQENNTLDDLRGVIEESPPTRKWEHLELYEGETINLMQTAVYTPETLAFAHECAFDSKKRTFLIFRDIDTVFEIGFGIRVVFSDLWAKDLTVAKVVLQLSGGFLTQDFPEDATPYADEYQVFTDLVISLGK